MNERIKELAKQAGFYFDEYNEVTQRKVELLTELIIKECTNMLPADTIRNEDGVHMFYVIREHFDVSVIGR